MKDINFMSLDLEMNQPSGSIIQVGACVGNLASGKILYEYQANIYQPEKLRGDIVTLTGIVQKDVDEGIPLLRSFSELHKIHENYECYQSPITWGGPDIPMLKNQVDGKLPFFFGRRWLDTKTMYILWSLKNFEKQKAGLKKAMNKLGMKFEGEAHNALVDAINTFRIFRALCEKMGR